MYQLLIRGNDDTLGQIQLGYEVLKVYQDNTKLISVHLTKPLLTKDNVEDFIKKNILDKSLIVVYQDKELYNTLYNLDGEVYQGFSLMNNTPFRTVLEQIYTVMKDDMKLEII